jgi:hypothetical protein
MELHVHVIQAENCTVVDGEDVSESYVRFFLTGDQTCVKGTQRIKKT